METHIIYILERGYWSKGGTYTSEMKEAKAFEHEAAIKFCRTRGGAWSQGGLVAVPLALADIASVLAK